jgi:hypothetical protein
MQGAALIGNGYAVVVLTLIHATTVIAVLMRSGAVGVRDGTIGVTMGVGDTRHRAGELGDKKEPNEPGNKLVPAPKQHDDNLLPTGNGNLAGFSHAVNAMGTWREQVGCSAFSALSRAITFHQTIPGRSPGIGIASKLRHPEQLHQDAQP